LTLNGGTLVFAADASQPLNLTLGAAGGTISVSGAADTRNVIGSTAVSFTDTQPGPRTLTLTGGTTSRRWQLPAVLADSAVGGGGQVSLAIAASGSGTGVNPDAMIFNLSAANTYTGNTIISRGVLRLGVANAISSGTGGLTSAATTGNIIFTGANRSILETNSTAGTITRSLGYGPGQIHWEGNGGFSNGSAAAQVVNLGGAGATLTWGTGGFVPTGSQLQFGQAAGNSLGSQGPIDFRNGIEFGTAARTVDVTTVNLASASGLLTAILSGNLSSGAGGGLVKSGIGTLLLTGNNSGGPATVNVSGGSLIFEDLAAIPGTGANITLSTTAANNAAIGMLGDTNPISTFGARLANPGAATAAFLLGADSSADLNFTGYSNMRLGAYSVLTPTGTPAVPVNAVNFTGTITPSGGTYRFGGQGTLISNTQAVGTLVLGRSNQLTGSNLVNISSGGLTITATNDVAGATSITNNGIEASMLGIGSDAALGTSAITFFGANTFRWGPVNGDRSVSNNIAWDAASAANWVPNGDAANDGILRNTSQGAMTYLGEINLTGRSNPTLTFRPGATLFLGDFGGAANGFTYSQSSGGYLSMLSTPSNAGAPKTYSGTTALGDNTNIVIDSEDSFGTSGNITLGNSIILLQPGTVSVGLGRNFVNTAAKNPSFNIPLGSTLTLSGTMSGSTTGVFVKQGPGDLVLRGDATAVLTTGSLQVRSGKLVLDAATLGSTVFPNVAISLGRANEFSNGGTLEITGTSAQSLGAVTVNQRANNINLTGAMTLTLGAITRTTGSTLNFSVPTGTVSYATASIAGLVNGATTWNADDWAAANGTNIFALGTNSTSYTPLTGTASAPTISTNATANYLISNATSNDVTLAAAGTLAAPNDVNTIKYNDSASRTIDLGSGFLRLGTGGAAGGGVTNAGGVLVASGSGALTFSGGSLMAGGTTTNTLGDLVFINNSSSDITVNSAIVANNGTTGTTPVVYDGRSTGKLILAGNNTFTGSLIINRGTVEVSTVNDTTVPGPLGQGTAAVGNILLNGGTFRANLGANGATNKGFTVGGPSTIEVVANTLTINSTVRGVVTDDIYHYGALNAGILTKTGAGTLELRDLATNANNANLSVRVAGGTLLLNKTTTAAISAINLPGAAGVIVNAVAAGNAPTLRLSGTGGNQISNDSSVVVMGDNTVKGVFDLNGVSETIDGLAGTGIVETGAGTATLTFGGNNSANLAPYTLAAAAAGLNSNGLNHFGGVIQDGVGTVAITKTGSGTQILSGNNTYSGATTINAGTLKLGIANALPSGAGKGDVTIAGNNAGVAVGGSGLVLAPGTLDLGGYDQSINGLNSSTGGFVTNNPTLAWNGSAWAVAAGVQGTKTFTLGNNDAIGSFNGVIQDGFSVAPGTTASGFVGGINLVKTGSNSQTLSGANTYSGSTAILNGSVILTGGTNRLPATTAVTLGNGADSGVLQIGGGSTVTQTLAGLATSGSGTANRVVGGNAANSTLILNQTGSSSYAGGLGGVGTNENNLNFTLQGGGTLTVSGTNTLSGTTTIQGGSTLVLGSNYAGTGGLAVGGIGAGTLTGTGFTVSGLTTVTANGTIAPGASALAADTGTLTFANGITLSGGTLDFGLGTTNDLINLTGGSFSVTTGSFISLAEVGTLALGTYDLVDYSFNSAALTLADWNNLSLTNNVIGANSYVASLVPYNTVPGKLQILIDNARFWSAQTNGVWDINGTANWSPGLRYQEGDKVIFADTFPPGSAPGTTNVSLNTTVTPGAITFQNASLTYSLDGSGAISGSASISKSGAGAVIIGLNNNAFSGSTGISAGSIEMRHSNALGSGNLSVSGTGELRLSGGISVGANALSLNGTGTASGGALRNLSGDNSLAGVITLGGTTRINSDAGTLTLSGGIATGTSGLTLGGAGNVDVSGVSAVLSGSGTLTVDGTGVVTLGSAANTYTGQTFINSGTLSVASLGSVGVSGGLGIPATVADATIALGSGTSTGTLRWTGSSSETSDRVIDLAGTTGGAVIEASGTSGSVLTLSSALTYSGTGAKTLTLGGSGGTMGTPNVLSGGIADGASVVVSLVKSGSGVWRLDAAGTHSGGTSVNSGTLLLNGADFLPTTAPTIGNGSAVATLNLGGNNQTFDGITFGGATATNSAQGILAIGSSGTLTLGGNVTFDATGNPLGASITGSGTSTLDLGGAARTFTVGSSSNAGGSDLTISAIIADADTGGSLVKTGAGGLVLTGANTYTGATTVDGGTLSVTPGALGSTSVINVGTNGTPGQFTLFADNAATGVTLPANTNLNVGSSTSLGYLGFDLGGTSSSDAITLSGTGSLTIGLAGGVINARAVSALTGSSYLLLDRNAATSIPINTPSGFYLGALPGGYSYSLDNTTDVGKLYLTVGSAAAGPYYWTGAQSTDSWAQLGGGGSTSNWATNQAGTIDAGATPGNITVIFSANNAGAAAINTTLDQAYSIAGLQFIGNSPATGNVSIAPGAGMGTLTLGSGGIDILTGASSTSTTISAPVILGANQAWGVADSGQTLTVSGAVSGSSSLTKSGAGTLVLGGANTGFSGAVAINGGIVSIGASNQLGDASATNTLSLAGGTLRNTGSSVILGTNRTVALGSGGGTLEVTTGNSLTVDGLFSGSTTLTKTGAGTLVLGGANTGFSGSVAINGGTLSIGASNHLGDASATNTLSLAGGTLRNTGISVTLGTNRTVALGTGGGTFDVTTGSSLTVDGALSGSTGLTKSGAGALVLGGANTGFSGSVAINGGTMRISAANNLGDGSAINTVTLDNAVLNGTATLSDSRGYTIGNANSTLTADSGTTYTIANSATTGIGGTGTLNLNGPGIVVLDDSLNANTFSGGTVISGLGTVRINTATSLGDSSGAVTLRDATLQVTADVTSSRNFALASYGATISVDSSRTYAVGGLFSDGSPIGTLNKAGAGILSLTRAAGNTYTGGTFVTGGTLLADNTSGSATGTGAVSVTGAGTTLGGSGLITGAVTLGGSGTVLSPGSAAAAGTLTLGSLTLGSGSVLNYQLGAPASSDKTVVGTSGGFTANGGQFNLTGLAGLTSGTYNLITYTGTLGGGFSNLSLASNYVNDGTNTFYAALVNNTGSVDLTTTNNLVWNGNQAGTIWQNGSTPSGNANWKTGTTTNLDFFNTMAATFDDTADAFTVNLSGSVSPASITVNAANDYTFADGSSGVIAGGTGLTKGNAGGLTINTANTFTGNTAINGGFIQMNNASALGTTGTIAIANGTSLILNDATGVNLASRITSIGGSGYDGNGAVQNFQGSSTIANALTLAAGTRFSATGGTLTLSGNLSGSSTAITLAASGTGNISLNGTSVSIANASFTVTNTGSGTVTVGNTVGVGTSAVVLNGTGTTTLNGAITSGSTTNGLQISSSGTNNINANVSVTGAAGGLSIAGSATTIFGAASVTSWNATGTAAISSSGNTTFNGTISGSGALTKSGAGILTLAGNSTAYNGNIAVNAGILRISNSGSLGTNTGTTAVASGAVLEIQDDITSADNLTLAGTGISGNGAVRNLSGDNTLSGTVTLSAATAVQSDAGTLTLSNTISGSGQNLTVEGAGNTTLSGAITTGTGTLTKLDAGILVLSGNSTYGGLTTVSAGTLRITHANALGSTAGGTTVANGAVLELGGGITTAAEPLVLEGSGLSNDGALRSRSGNNTYAGNVTLAAASRIQSDADTLTLGGAVTGTNTNLTFSGAGNGNVSNAAGVSIGSGDLVKEGAGVLSFNASTSSSVGSTTVNGGDLIVNGTLTNTKSGTNVTVGSSSFLGGDGGTVVGTTLINGGLSTGTDTQSFEAGALTFTGDVTFGSGSFWFVDLVLGSGSTASDSIAINGNLNITSGAALSILTGNTFTQTEQFTIATFTGNRTGEFTFGGSAWLDGEERTIDGNQYLITYGTGSITLTAVPEPGTLGLLGLALGGFFFRRLRKRREVVAAVVESREENC
jgi:autotransporter-associated beta strand protein